MSSVNNLVIVYTGNGKGKTTAALGLAVRWLGQGGRVCICQFIKANTSSGENKFFNACIGAELHLLGRGFVSIETSKEERKKHCQAARDGLQFLIDKITSRLYSLIIADELLDAYSLGFITVEEILHLIDSLPSGTHLVLTGRSAPAEVVSRADTVTNMQEIKHHYNNGTKAVKGIEF